MRMVPNLDAPCLELALMAIDGAELHLHLLRDRRHSGIGAAPHGDVVRVAVNTVRSPTHDRGGREPRDLLLDALRYLGLIRLFDATVRIIPELVFVDRKRKRGRLQLRAPDVGEILLARSGWLADPSLLPACRADQVDVNSGPRVSEDEASGAHRLVVWMGHDDEQASHPLRSSISHAWSSRCHAIRRAAYRGGHLFS